MWISSGARKNELSIHTVVVSPHPVSTSAGGCWPVEWAAKRDRASELVILSYWNCWEENEPLVMAATDWLITNAFTNWQSNVIP